MNFLNNGTGYKLFAEAALCDTYVDKTMMIDTLYRYVCAGNKYICVTRPRRFGKSVNANMIAAFFDKSTGEESRELFQQLALGMLQPEQDKCFAANPRGTEERKLCWPRQGKLNVIRINMIDVLFDTVQSFAALHSKLAFLLREDLQHQYPDLTFPAEKDLPELLMQTGESFVFVIDEWDAFFETPSVTESDKQQYLLFLKGLLKDKSYVHLGYMTGILPIAKNPSGSPLNMFHEFSAFQDDQFSAYFGFTREEIQDLMQRKGYTQPSLEELIFWYDGYARPNDGVHMFNPVSVSRALIDKKCRSYWTGTGPVDEIRDMIHRNVHDLRENIIHMVGGALPIRLSGFSVEENKVSEKDEILSAMVVYGFLSYSNGQLRIPNHELMLKFQSALTSEELGLNQTLEASRRLLYATLEQRDREVAALIEILHTEKIPFFNYKDENSLACTVTMGYLAALDDYRITREDTAGNGEADFTFEPKMHREMPIILELKYNRSVKYALKCIKEKGYIHRFRDYPKVLLVGINYSEKTKKHTCKTEQVCPLDILPKENEAEHFLPGSRPGHMPNKGSMD